MVTETKKSKADIINEKLDKYGMDFFAFCRDNLKIKEDKPGAPLIPFILNDVQVQVVDTIMKLLIEGKPARVVVLKARRVGISTAVAALFFWWTSVADIGENTNAYILSNDDDGVSYLFRMHKIFYDEMDPDIRPLKRYDTKKVLTFENPDDNTRGQYPGRRSQINVASAAKHDVGSGSSTDLLHCSELAKWDNPEETLTAMLNAVPLEGVVVYESTAKGRGNYFHNEWRRAEEGDSDYVAIFIPWYKREKNKQPVKDPVAFEGSLSKEEKAMKKQYGLSDEQMQWRRWCIKNQCRGKVSIFKQEHPITPNEAFIATGECYLDIPSLEYYESKRPEPVWVGDIRFVKNEKGEEFGELYETKEKPKLFIYEYPRVGIEYVSGTDVAEGAEVGNDRKDRSSHHILKKDLTICAHYLGQVPPEILAKVITTLGHYYNWPLAGVEANMHGRHVIIEMRDHTGYPIDKIYKRMRYDESTNEHTEKLGWYTSGGKNKGGTRGPMLDNLEARIRERDFLWIDHRTVKECYDFVEVNGKMQANAGCHDDCVFSLGIGAYMVKDGMAEVGEFKMPEAAMRFNQNSIKM